MEINQIKKRQWYDIKKIYHEAFPKKEQKPFWLLKKAVKQGKSEIWVATENGLAIAFIMLTDYRDMVLVEYLAVSGIVRGKGTGTKILQMACSRKKGKRMALLIEQIRSKADNREQQIARKHFYIKNGFIPSGIFIQSTGGSMEVLCYGGPISKDEFISIHTYVLGKLFFLLSKTKILKKQ